MKTDLPARSTKSDHYAVDWHNTTSHLQALSLGLHWLMLVLIAAAYACIELRENFPKGSGVRDGLKTWHFVLGLSILVLVLIRIVIRLFGPSPRIDASHPAWQRVGAKLMHVGLYVFMIGMPLLGWLTLSAEGKQVQVWGVLIPALIGSNATVAEWTQELHEIGGTVGYILIALHAAAALFHHYVLRDQVLRRMLGAGD